MKEFKKRKKFPKDFKRETVRRVIEDERHVPDLALDLGVHPNTIYRWVKEFRDSGEEAFPGNGNLPASEAELHRLRRALAESREENEILKKAIAFFSKEKL